MGAEVFFVGWPRSCGPLQQLWPAAAGQAVAARVKEIRPADALRVMRAFAKCNVQHEALCRAVGDHVTGRVQAKGVKGGFTCEDIVEIAWDLCVLEAYHEDLFKLMFKQLEESPKVATDALCMAHECHLCLD